MMSLMLLGGLSLGITYLISGLIINLLQVFFYILIRPFSKTWQRKVNYYLNYISWSQLVNASQWWSRTEVRIYDEDDSLKMLSKEHTLTLMNHRYEVDWLICWIICDRLGTLGSAKSFIKNELKKIPVIGWGWACSEMIFLKRNWDEDSQHLAKQLDALVEYEDKVNILMFSEGTRYTKGKFEASMEFAKKRGLKEMKYHLIPRSRGFVFCAQHLKGKMKAFYNLQLCFPPNGPEPTFRSILMGEKLVADVYIKRIPLEDIPTETETECSQWLNDLYQCKDKLMEDYLKTGKFPGKCSTLKRSYAPLFCTLICTLFLALPIFYTIIGNILVGQYFVPIVIISILSFFYMSSYLLVGITQTKHGSSYGKGSNGTTETNGIKLKSS